MDQEHLNRLADVTRRYAQYRPCAAGLGVAWAGLLQAMLAYLALQPLVHAFGSADGAHSFLQFARTHNMVPPDWLKLLAIGVPLLSCLGIVVLQNWVDRQFGVVEGKACAGIRVRWFGAACVIFMAAVLTLLQLLDPSVTLGLLNYAGIAGVAACAVLWGPRSRDQLTQTVLMFVSVPSLFLLASSGSSGYFLIFMAYCPLLAMLIGRGVRRFVGFLSVRRALQTMDGMA
ncbi:MAG: hypothetical protein V4582_14335 [Pseudomonadota bacterium]